MWVCHRFNAIQSSFLVRLLRKFNLKWEGRCHPGARYIPSSKNSAISYSLTGTIPKHTESYCFSFRLVMGKIQGRWMRNTFLMWKIHNSQKFPLPCQEPEFPRISLKCADDDNLTRTQPCYLIPWGVRLDKDGYFLTNQENFEALGIRKILWRTFAINCCSTLGKALW